MQVLEFNEFNDYAKAEKNCYEKVLKLFGQNICGKDWILDNYIDEIVIHEEFFECGWLILALKRFQKAPIPDIKLTDNQVPQVLDGFL